MGEFISIQPTELKFQFELKKQSSCSLQLANRTDQYIAFKKVLKGDIIGSFEQRIIELESVIEEKDRLVLELKTRENEFEDHRTESARRSQETIQSDVSILGTGHEDECRRLQEELDIQKAKEERQRALLQLQWKVMSDHPHEDQEVNSKKHYSISSTKRNSDSGKKNHHALDKTEVGQKDSPYLKATETPVTTLLRKEIPKHSRKVTHREYEIETSNGRTITKRKKTRSTVMFEDPRKQRRRETPKAKTPKQVIQGAKSRVSQIPSNIGHLFCEGSLNPYTDDPYAFD